MQVICLDYDGTFSKFPGVFDNMIDYCKKNGITVILATMRYPSEKDDVLTKLEQKIKVYYTCRKAKAKFLLDNYKISPDVWIDDQPMLIYEDTV